MAFIIPLIIWAVGQTCKFLLNAVKRGKLAITDFTESGGMPSVHTAVVTSLSTMIGIKEGFSSSVFAATFIFSLIIIHDALRLRSVVETHSKILNRLRLDLSQADKKLHPETIEHVGHRLPEVVAGILLGFFGTILLVSILGA